MPFNPQQHMRSIERRQKYKDSRGQDQWRTVKNEYLDVKWRIVWFRDEQPTGSIVTELLSGPESDVAVVRATISYWVEEQQVVATGMGRVDKGQWPRHLEKAETTAIGRALGLLGYGTQFADDFEEEDALADSPVQMSPGTAQIDTNRSAAPGANGKGASRSSSGGGSNASPEATSQRRKETSKGDGRLNWMRHGDSLNMLVNGYTGAIVDIMEAIGDSNTIEELNEISAILKDKRIAGREFLQACGALRWAVLDNKPAEYIAELQAKAESRRAGTPYEGATNA